MWLGAFGDATNGKLIWKHAEFELWRYIFMIFVTSMYGYLIANHSSAGMTSWNVSLPTVPAPWCLGKQEGSPPTALCGGW